MNRVAITGYGVISSIGNNRAEVTASLRDGTSGIVAMPDYAEKNFRSRVAGTLKVDPSQHIDRKLYRFMGQGPGFGYLTMKEAIEHAGLTPAEISHDRTGLVYGMGVSPASELLDAVKVFEARGARKILPYYVPRTMSSAPAANLATAFHIRGVNYSMSSACATSSHAVGHAGDLIRLGRQDIVFAGGADELHWIAAMMFDAMGALSSKYNETPATASRPYDAHRDGFVISAGAGTIVLENWDHAKARGARILGELVGFGATSDGADMVSPSGEGAVRCMRESLRDVHEPVDYLNTHGTSTPAGDITELNAARAVFGDRMPKVSSTKALTGHSLGAAGVHEAIYSLIMLNENFLAASANIETLDPAAEGVPLLRQRLDNSGTRVAMTNSFGFGGTNATLVFRKD